MIKRQVYLIPNAITAFGLACGLLVIFKVNMIEPGSGTYDVLRTSLILLLLAALADLLDGAVARVMRAESEFGFMFDSLADAVSFGVAPSVLLLKSLSLEQGTGLSLYAVTGALLFSICGILRLVRFNVKASEVKGNAILEEAQKKNFTGLPIPASAVAAVSLNLFMASPLAERWFKLGSTAEAIILSTLMIVLGFLMISRWKFPSLKVLHFQVPSFHLVLMTTLLTVFVLYGMMHFLALTLVCISWGYISLGLVLSTARMIAGKKSKTLEDFEPEEDEIE
jgi:CDP-diacylglycerol--serine O-phosphatidyltransferase